MNLSELRTRLDTAGVRRDVYSLNERCGEEMMCLERTRGRWAVYYSERGLRSGERSFETESEACEHLLNLLLRDPTTQVE